MINFLIKAIITYLCVYGIINRVCECIERVLAR